MRVYDYKHNSFDLVISGGDFAKDESTAQHMELLMLLDKGECKQYPLLGVGIRTYLLDDRSLTDFESEACAQLEDDGIKIRSFDPQAWDKIKVEGEYEGK